MDRTPAEPGASRVLLLRLWGNMMSFGEHGVGDRRVTRDFPPTSWMTGLIANALGYCRPEWERHERLQAALRYAVRCDRVGALMSDYQTVDLGQPWMDPDRTAWTTSGEVGKRRGSSGGGTHVKRSEYINDAVYTVAQALVTAAGVPSLAGVAAALTRPARPLFLGRKCCLSAVPLVLGWGVHESVLVSLLEAQDIPRDLKATRHEDAYRCWWLPESAPGLDGEPERVLGDHRDWRNQTHVGDTVWMHTPLTRAQVRAHFGFTPTEATSNAPHG